MENKWEVRSHSYQIADTGDYDGYWEITNGKISICTKEDGEDMDVILQEVADLLNKTEISFFIDNPKEVDLHFECEGLKIQLSELQAKCERYEQLLHDVHKKAKEGIFPHLPVETMGAQKCVEIDAVLNEALSAREGEKEGKK